MKGIWRHLFMPKAATAKAAQAETKLTAVVDANKAARSAVTIELEKVLRDIAGDLTDAADKIGGRRDGQ